VAATGGNASTFLFDTNIEDLVPRVTKGLQAVQRAVNAESKGQSTKLTSNLPRDLARLVNDSQKQVAQLNKALAETGKVKGGGSLTGGYQRIVDDLHRKIGQVTSGRGLTAEVGLKFAKGPIEALVKQLHDQLSNAALSANPKVSRNVGIGQFNPTKGQFEAGFNGDPAANKKIAQALKARTATESKLTNVAKETLRSDQAGATAAKTSASARSREAKARTKIADDAEKEAATATTRRRTATKKAVAAPVEADTPAPPTRKRKTKAQRAAEEAALQDVIDGIPKRTKQTVTQKAAAAKVVQDKVDASRPVDQRVNDEAAQRTQARKDAREAAKAATTVPAAVRAATIPDVAIGAAPAQLDSSATAATAADWVASTQRSARAQQRLASIVDAMAAAAAAREARYRAEGAIPVKPVIPLGAEPRRQRAIGQRGDASGSALDLPRLEAQQVQAMRALLDALRQQAGAVRQTTDIIRVTATLWDQIRREVQRILEAGRRRAAIEAGGARRAITGDTGARALGAGSAGPGGDGGGGRSTGGQVVPRGGQDIVPRDARGELVPLARVTAQAFDLPRRAIESGLNRPDPAVPIRNQAPELTPKQQRLENYRRLTNGLDEFQRGVKPIDSKFVADTRGTLLRIYQQVTGGFKEIERGTPEFFAQARRFNAQQARAARAAAGGGDGGSAPIDPQERRAQRRNQRDLSSGRGDNELAEGVNPIGGVGSRFVSDTRGAQERIFRRTRDGFAEIERGTSEFEALARRLRQQQQQQGAGARGGILNNFLSTFTSGSSFGSGNNGQRPTLQGAIEGLSRSAGTTAKYAILGQTFFAIQQAASAAGAEILDFEDSVTELNIALEGAANDGKEVHTTISTINSLADSATLAGVNVGQAMDLAASAIRAFKSDTDGTQASMEALGVRFSAQASKIKTITGGDFKDVSDNLKATALAFDTTDFSRVTDVVAGSKRVGGGAENDIQSGIAASAIAAKEAGFSLEETGVLISKIVAETSESGQLAATRFSKITAILGGSAGKNAIRTLNKSLAPDKQINVSGTIADQIKQLSAVYGDLGESQRQQLVNSLGGTANARELIVLLKDAATLTAEADKGFTGEGAEEYKRRLADIRATLTAIRGEFRNIISAIAGSGVFDPLYAAIKFGLLPALELTRQLLQTFNLIPRPLRTILFTIGELYLLMKLISAVGRTGVLGNFFAGAVNPARRATQEAAAAAAAARGGAGSVTPIIAGRRGAPVPLPAPPTGPRPGAPVLPTIIPRGARILGADGQLLSGRAAEQARRAANNETRAARRAEFARRQEAAAAGQPPGRRTSVTGLRRDDVLGPLRGAGAGVRDEVRQGRAGFNDARRQIAERRLAELRTTDPRRAAVLDQARDQARRQTLDRQIAAADRDRLAQARANRANPAAAGSPESRQRIADNIARNQEQAARRAERAALGPNAGPRSARQRIQDAATRARFEQGNVNGARGFGPNALPPGTPGAPPTLRNRISGIGAAVGPELGIMAGLIAVTGMIQAGKKISAAVTEFNKLKGLPDSFGVTELQDSATNLRSAAHQLNEASSGFFGTIVNFARGDETGARSDDLIAAANIQKSVADRIKRAEEATRNSQFGDLSATIDLSSSDSISSSLEAMDSSGRSATTQLEALKGAMDRVGTSATGASANLSALQKVQVSGQVAARLTASLRSTKEDARYRSTTFGGAETTIPNPFGLKAGLNVSAGTDAAESYFGLGSIRALRRQDNGVGRLFRKTLGGGKDVEENFNLSQVDIEATSLGFQSATQQFLNSGGDILSETGKTDLTQMYTDWLIAHEPDLTPAQIAALAKDGYNAARTSVRDVTDVNDSANTLDDVLKAYEPLAQKRAEEAANQAALGIGPNADKGQALTQSEVYLNELISGREAARKKGASKADLEKADNQIAAATIANNANVRSRQESRNQFELAKLGDSDASGRAKLAREQADKALEDAGYDPKTGKRKTKTVTITSDSKTFSDSRDSRGLGGVTEVDPVTTTREENVGPGLSAEDYEKARGEQLAAERAEKAEQLKNKVSARRLKIDPRDEVRNAEADLQDAKDQRDALIAEGTKGAALDDAKLQVRKAKLNLAQTELDNSISARNVNAIPASSLDTAQRNLRDGHDRLKLLKKGTTAYNQQLAQNVQAQIELATAQADVASIQRQLSIDLTNPVQVANEAVTTAKAALARAKQQTAGKDVDPLVRAQVVGTAELELRNAEANAEAAAFSQWLSNTQTANSLGRISHKAYLSMLQNRADALTAELSTMKDTDPMYQQIKDQRDQLLATVKASAEELSGQFNLGDIKIPSVYEVRRALKAGDRGEILANNAASSTAGNVTYDTSTRNVTLNGVPVQQIMKMIEDMFGIKARTKASRRNP
jgi:hypothetical protein